MPRKSNRARNDPVTLTNRKSRKFLTEGLRRHRHGARFTIERISELGGLRRELPPDHAIALLSAATAHDAWYELVHAHELSWDQAEQTLNDALTRAILRPN